MMVSFVLSILLLAIVHVNGAGDFVFYEDSSCQNGYTYMPAVFVMGVPSYWDGQCLNVLGSNEHFELIFKQNSTSASFHLQIWAPTLYCGWMFSNTATDTFDVSSDTPDITCRQGIFTSQNITYSITVPVWITIVPDYGSSTALPPPIIESSSSEPPADWSSSGSSRSSSRSPHVTASSSADTKSSSTGISSSYTPMTSVTSEPFPFDSSILNPTGPVVPDSNEPFPTGEPSSSTGTPVPDNGDPDKSSNAMVIGIVSGVVFVVVLLAAVGIFLLVKRRRRSQDALPLQDRSSLHESLYARDARYSDDY